MKKSIEQIMAESEQTVCAVMGFLESVGNDELRNALQDAWDGANFSRDENPDFKFEGWRNS